MKFPTAQQKSRIRLAEIIYAQGAPICLIDLIELSKKPIGSAFEAKRSIRKMIDNGMLIEESGKLRLSYDMVAWIEDRHEIAEKRAKPEVVPARTASPFKPFNLAMYAGVRERLNREIIFKNGLQTPVAFHSMDAE